MRLLPVLLALAAIPAAAQPATDARPVVVGSKAFTESVVLGEIAARLVRSSGHEAEHRRQLGGSRFLWEALLRGDVDLYPEYSGTLLQELLAERTIASDADLRAALDALGLRMSRPLGFNNTYALGMRAGFAEARGVRSISDLARYPDLRLGFSNEFMDREDGWPGLRAHYGLPHTDVQGLDHDLAYRGLESGVLDATDCYATDAEIAYYGLRTLVDDRDYFPAYEAIWLYRADLAEHAPEAVAALLHLEGRLTDSTMIALNARAKIDRVPVAQVAADFVRAAFGVETAVETDSRSARVWRRTVEHLELVFWSLLAAIGLAIPLGVAAAKRPRLGSVILGVVGVIYTIPSLALLVFMIPLLGIGAVPAMVALFLYSLLPIVRNTHAGLLAVPPHLRDSAEALGLPPAARLRLVELPMAMPAILAGVKTSAVINIGTATLGALIGAGGYGQPILTGIRLDDVGLILEGAVPAALLALAAQWAFDGLERLLVPKGLRLKPDA